MAALRLKKRIKFLVEELNLLVHIRVDQFHQITCDVLLNTKKPFHFWEKKLDFSKIFFILGHVEFSNKSKLDIKLLLQSKKYKFL